ncbi:hypothetical protein ACFPIF_12030 [Brevundimonas faecalis]|uniref:hypothetical protein n=1 Tax=Brevundimonas faecalis TaxID=947378 RepID=UPI0036122A08
MVFDLGKRRLRGAVADLSRLSPEDLQGVLDLMPPHDARIVKGLLEEWSGAASAPSVSPPPAAPLSDWLAQRLAPGSAYPITDAVRETLSAFTPAPVESRRRVAPLRDGFLR